MHMYMYMYKCTVALVMCCRLYINVIFDWLGVVPCIQLSSCVFVLPFIAGFIKVAEFYLGTCAALLDLADGSGPCFGYLSCWSVGKMVVWLQRWKMTMSCLFVQ